MNNRHFYAFIVILSLAAVLFMVTHNRSLAEELEEQVMYTIFLEETIEDQEGILNSYYAMDSAEYAEEIVLSTNRFPSEITLLVTKRNIKVLHEKQTAPIYFGHNDTLKIANYIDHLLYNQKKCDIIFSLGLGTVGFDMQTKYTAVARKGYPNGFYYLVGGRHADDEIQRDQLVKELLMLYLRVTINSTLRE